MYKLGLDLSAFAGYNEKAELKKQRQTPSPIRRVEDSLFINNLQSFDLSMDMSSLSQNEDSMPVRSSSQLSRAKLSLPGSLSRIGSHGGLTTCKPNALSKSTLIDTINESVDERSCTDFLKLEDLDEDELKCLLGDDAEP